MEHKNKVNALNNSFVTRFRDDTQKLTSTQRRLKQYLLSHAVDVGYMSLKELAEKAGVSEVSILNLCVRCGFENYMAFREAFRDDTRSRMESSFLNPSLPPSFSSGFEGLYQYCGEITDGHNDMLQSLDLALLEQCARTLASSRDVLIFSHDMSKIAADYLSSRLTYLRLRSRSISLGDLDTVQLLLAGLEPGDAVILLSFPPYYMPSKDVAAYVCSHGAVLITLTDGGDSPVILDGGMNFICKTRNPYFFNSMSVPIHFIEILAYYTAMVMGKTSEDIINTLNTVGSHFTNKGEP